LSLVSAVIRGRWLLTLERVKSNRELVVLQMHYRGRAASGRRFWRISRRDFRTSLPGASGAEFLPFLNSPRRSRAVTVRKTHT